MKDPSAHRYAGGANTDDFNNYDNNWHTRDEPVIKRKLTEFTQKLKIC
jgi:hypothetical protein